MGIVCAMLGAFIYYESETAELPEIETLSSESGKLQWVKETSVGARGSGKKPRFKLRGSAKVFGYSSKSGRSAWVLGKLEQTSSEVVEVLYDENEPGRPLFSNTEVFSVYSISIGGRKIRSYEEVASAWDEDNATGRYLGAFFVLLGLGLPVLGFKMHLSRASNR